MVALLIMIESPGNPLFTQRRTGYQGTPFVIYKFRTMRVREDGPTVVQAAKDDTASPESASSCGGPASTNCRS